MNDWNYCIIWQNFHVALPMKRVKLNMTNKIVYNQTFDLLEHSIWNLFEFQFQFNWSLRSSNGNFVNNVRKSILN